MLDQLLDPGPEEMQRIPFPSSVQGEMDILCDVCYSREKILGDASSAPLTGGGVT